jgi:hypothetical protein
MKRCWMLALVVTILIVGACTSKKAANNAQPGASPGAAGGEGNAAAKPGTSATPVAQGTIPAQIPEMLRRPLTHEEIMKLPPETRDMILRAQGKPVPTPSPTKKN